MDNRRATFYKTFTKQFKNRFIRDIAGNISITKAYAYLHYKKQTEASIHGIDTYTDELIDRLEMLEFLIDLVELNEIGMERISCQDVISMIEFKEEISRLQIEIKYETSDVQFLGNAKYLSMALHNILENSILAGCKSGIVVKTDIDANQVKISVVDKGTCLYRSAVDHMFDPFYSEYHSRAQGWRLGVGLTIARWIVWHHGGEISVEGAICEDDGLINLNYSNESGTTVNIVFPNKFNK